MQRRSSPAPWYYILYSILNISSLVSSLPGWLFLSSRVTWKAGYNQTDTQTTQEDTCKSDSINIMTLPISHFFNVGPSSVRLDSFGPSVSPGWHNFSHFPLLMLHFLFSQGVKLEHNKTFLTFYFATMSEAVLHTCLYSRCGAAAAVWATASLDTSVVT